MPLIAVHRDGKDVHEYVSGTAFVVGRGYAVTAYHVIEDLVARFAGIRATTGTLKLDFELLTFLSLDKNTRVLPMRVLRCLAGGATGPCAVGTWNPIRLARRLALESSIT